MRKRSRYGSAAKQTHKNAPSETQRGSPRERWCTQTTKSHGPRDGRSPILSTLENVARETRPNLPLTKPTPRRIQHYHTYVRRCRVLQNNPHTYVLCYRTSGNRGVKNLTPMKTAIAAPPKRVGAGLNPRRGDQPLQQSQFRTLFPTQGLLYYNGADGHLAEAHHCSIPH